MTNTYGLTNLPAECAGKVTIQTGRNVREMNSRGSPIQGLDVKAFPLMQEKASPANFSMAGAMRRAAEANPEAMAKLINQ